MIAAIEIALLGIAVLLDLWIGSIGAMPMFSCYCACHWAGVSGAVPGVVAAFVAGIVIDLVYGRLTPITLWLVPAAVLAALLTMPAPALRRGFLRSVMLPGAAAGAVIGLGRWLTPICFGASPIETLHLAELLLWSITFGALFFAAIVWFLDVLFEFLGVTGFCRNARPRLGGAPRERFLRVRGSLVRGSDAPAKNGRSRR